MNSTYSPVPELNLLMDLQERLGYEGYADGFGLTGYNDTSGLEAGWSKDPAFLDRLIPFAAATGGGSFYALWRVDDRAELGSLPVVVFGDEGGQHVVARNLPELFQLLAYDTEVTVDQERAYYYRGAHHRHRDGHAAFVAWLGEHFGLPPATGPHDPHHPDRIVAAAQAEYGDRFAAWTAQHLPG